MKALVVDDELVTRNKLKKMLDDVCDVVSIFDNGSDAIKMFETALSHGEPYDFIVLDIVMPDKDGIDVLLSCREIESHLDRMVKRPVAILMITSTYALENITSSFSKGCDDYLLKPFDKAMLIDKLKGLGISL